MPISGKGTKNNCIAFILHSRVLIMIHVDKKTICINIDLLYCYTMLVHTLDYGVVDCDI